MQMPTPKVLRLARSKFRALAAEGLDIQVSPEQLMNYLAYGVYIVR